MQVPDSFSLYEAASMPDNYATAMFTIFGTPNLALPLPSSWPAPSPPPNADAPILVYGASSSSGQFMIQVLKLAGYTNIFAAASARNHAYLQELGAKKCFDYRSPEFVKNILQASGGAKMSIVIDSIAAKPSIEKYSGVVGEGTRVALLMPVKEGDKVTNDVTTEMYPGLPPWLDTTLPGARILPIFTFRMQEVRNPFHMYTSPAY